MSATLKANEPSMEEILASIRRIIAEDSSPAAEAAPEPVPEASAAEEDIDVLDLATIEPDPDPADDIEFREVAEPLIITRPPDPPPLPEASEPAYESPAPDPEPLQETPRLDADGLLSPVTAAMVSSAFGSLGALHVPRGGGTLEDLVKDMLRPLLKGWLDENLPGLVERLVRAEIERVSRPPRG